MRTVTYAEALNEALREEMRRDPSVFVMGEDIALLGGIFGVTKGLLTEFGPDRVRDAPISEAAIVGHAIGAAVAGMRPVVELGGFVDFLALAMDQLVNQAAKLRYMFGGKGTVPIVVRAAQGAGVKNAAQHSQSLEAWFVHVPGLIVVAPSTPADAKGLLLSAIRNPNPVVFLEHKLLYFTKGEVPDGEGAVPIGQGVCRRAGTDVTLVTYSAMTLRCLEAAEVAEKEGISCEVVDLRTLQPMDTALILDSLRKTGRLIVVHEACRRGGLGGEITAVVNEQAFDCLDAPIVRVAGLDIPVPFNEELERETVPSTPVILDAIRKLAG